MTRTAVLIALLSAACTAPVDAPDAVADLESLRPGVDFNADLVLVGSRTGTPERARFQRESLAPVHVWDALGAASFEVPAGADVVDVIEDLRASGDFDWVEPDFTRHAFAVANDPYRSYQWHFDAINLNGAWDYSTGSGAVVAVIDTGATSGPYDGLSHLGSGYDFVNGDSNAADDNGHGTHVSGTINQATNNSAGVSGVAYNATIMPVKVLDAAGSGYSTDIIDGIMYAADHGADVINMSLGSRYSSTSEESAVNYAAAAGVFIACAAGNDGRSGVSYPARYAEAVAVGATDARDVRVTYSNYGAGLELMAPGGNTSRDDNGDGYVDGVLQETFSGTSWGYYFFQGTSMASPHVAGVAALLSAAGADRDEIRQVLKDTAVDLGSAGYDSYYGYGLIDAEAALYAFPGTATDDDGDGWTTADGDCDDTDASVYPGAPDPAYDGVDSDCAGDSDYDYDGDGYDSDLYGGADCDDADATIYPGAYDAPYDGIDADCDGGSDYDGDGDGHDSVLYGGADCDDTDAASNPGAAEVCDGADNDCDGLTDDADPGVTDQSWWYVDDDSDGYGASTPVEACFAPSGTVSNGDDCDDTDDTIYPGAPEVCEDTIDQDCDGVDETCSTGDTTPPVITSASYSKSRKYLSVNFTTDELATGEVCTNRGYCDTTPLGTSHATGWFYISSSRTFTIEVTDEAGNTATYGPYSI